MREPKIKTKKKDDIRYVTRKELKSALGRDFLETYQINVDHYNDGVSIHGKHIDTYVNCRFDDDFKIVVDTYTVEFINSRCNISLWKDSYNIHVTIYR